MVSVTMKELLEAGVHFGHQVRRWNSKMKEYIFGERNGIYIIDLQKTQRMFRDALGFVTNAIAEDRGKTVLFSGRATNPSYSNGFFDCGFRIADSGFESLSVTNLQSAFLNHHSSTASRIGSACGRPFAHTSCVL